MVWGYYGTFGSSKIWTVIRLENIGMMLCTLGLSSQPLIGLKPFLVIDWAPS